MRTQIVWLACAGVLAACGGGAGQEAESGTGGTTGGASAIAGGTGGSSGGTAPGTGGGSGAASGSGGSSESGGSSGSGGSGESGGSSGSGATGGATGGSGGSGARSGSGAGGSAGAPEPGSRDAERAALDEELAELEGLTAATLVERYPTSFEPAPTYEPSEIAGLDQIQASGLALTGAEEEALTAKGFVISGTRAFPSFAYGYASIYAQDLPVYVSADSILDSVHRSYDSLLERIETAALAPKLTSLLAGMRARLASGIGAELGDDVRADADTFLAVAASLLAGQQVEPVAGGSSEQIGSLFTLATQASGTAGVTLFGVDRMDEDFSQFKPRGHYTDSLDLGRYFRAMMWLGRIDFRLLETQSGGARVFRRRPLEGMLLIDALIDPALRAEFDVIDRAIGVFVGEPDYMVLSEVASLREDLGITTLADAAGVSDEAFERALLDGGYGLQRISSHVMMNGLAAPGTLPLNVSFALLGQRYVIDSHVFSNVVFDRAGGGTIGRMMPNPLDVAFAVLQNDQAAALLAPELTAHPYAPDLAAMRLLADRHPPEFWSSTLYNLWLGALRELSPAAIVASADADALPPTFRSEAWGRRLLATGLASWAQLRHDTLLYAKQSYTSGQQCEFPDGYVDPYPEFYEKLAEYAERGKEALGGLVPEGGLGGSVDQYFDNLLNVATRLREMAVYQRTGAPYTQEMLDFLNTAVAVSESGCGPAMVSTGWYRQLFFDPMESAESAPTIADVHTQPFDELGAQIGKVLHVGTGDARFMVVVAETCSGPRAYAGLASSYQELVTSNFERLDDEAWEARFRDEPDVPWAAELVTR